LQGEIEADALDNHAKKYENLGYDNTNAPTSFFVMYTVKAMSITTVVKVPIGLFGRRKWSKAMRDYKLDEGEVLTKTIERPFK